MLSAAAQFEETANNSKLQATYCGCAGEQRRERVGGHYQIKIPVFSAAMTRAVCS